MGEIRRNPLFGGWVIMAPERGRRPHDAGGGRVPGSRPRGRSRWREGCPFCPGNEALLAGVLLELPAADGEGWQTRTVANKYPALGGAAGPPRGDDLHRAVPGSGRHEVIIESPRHDRDAALATEAELAVVLETYLQRYRSARALPGVAHVLVFRNHGERAGTSLVHPHSQLIATPVLPEAVLMREIRCREHYAERGTCLLCDIAERERSDGSRLVLDTPGFTVFVPYAAEVPYELWVVPTRHRTDFADIDSGERDRLATCLHRLLPRLRERLGDPDYNTIIHSAGSAEEAWLHWFLQIRPRITTRAGFEIGSGMSINTMLPEDGAAELR